MTRPQPDQGLKEIKANWGDAIAALDALPILAIGVALGVAGVLVTALFAKLLSADREG